VGAKFKKEINLVELLLFVVIPFFGSTFLAVAVFPSSGWLGILLGSVLGLGLWILFLKVLGRWQDK
jgi:hypothetical protein